MGLTEEIEGTINQHTIDNTSVEQLQKQVKALAIQFARFQVTKALEIASNNARIKRQWTGSGQKSSTEISKTFTGDLGYEDYIPVQYTVDKESITNYSFNLVGL